MRTLALSMATAAVALAADLPVRQVILYKHGVGFFERSGDLAAGESARLDFKASEMDDVLKSLTLSSSGAKIAGLRYDSAEPLAQKLADFPFQMDGTASLASFLNQMKGARLELKIGPETLAGAIVSARTVPATQNQREQEQVVLLLDSAEIRTIDLSAATAMKFSDPKLQSQLKDYLQVVAASRSKEKRSVYVDSSGSGSQKVSASYMIPMPVWKSSYRLIFGESGEPMLEGWAIVDNTTGEDWTNVNLAVVSGRPISFLTTLYEPKYVNRRRVELAEAEAMGPVVHEAAMDDARAVAGMTAPAPAAPPRMAKSMARAEAAAPGRLQQFGGLERSNVAATAGGRDLGDLFEYRFSTPVTVKKGQSAMLPFLQQKLGARKLLIYSDLSRPNPMNAAELTNSTGKTLDGGPITVYDNNAYAGEALVETVKAGDKRLISYGVDLGTRVTTAFDSSESVIREIRASNGVLETRAAVQETTTYTIRNVDPRAKTLIIERSQRPGYKVISPKPAETTRNSNRFEVKLAANAEQKLAVVEENEFSNSYAVTDMTPELLLTWVQNKKLSDTGRKQLQVIADRKRQIVDLNRELGRLAQAENQINQDQQRIRQNISSLNQVAGQQQQVQRYAATLASQEGELAKLRDQQNDVRNRTAALESELKSLIDKLEF